MLRNYRTALLSNLKVYLLCVDPSTLAQLIYRNLTVYLLMQVTFTTVLACDNCIVRRHGFAQSGYPNDLPRV